MKWIQTTFRITCFLGYLFAVVGLPFFVVWGWSGFLASLPLDFALVLWLRVFGYKAIYRRLGGHRRLGIQLSSWDAFSSLKNAVREMARRLNIRVPELVIINHRGFNIGSFGFSARHSALIVTPAVLELPKDELLALVARQLVEIHQMRSMVRSWLAQFIAIIDRMIGTHRPRQSVPFRLFLREVILWPLTLIPFWCLQASSREELLDRRSLKVSGASALILAQAYRRLELENLRGGESELSVDLRPLFLIQPACTDSLVKSIVYTETLNLRIARLEKLWRQMSV